MNHGQNQERCPEEGHEANEEGRPSEEGQDACYEASWSPRLPGGKPSPYDAEKEAQSLQNKGVVSITYTNDILQHKTKSIGVSGICGAQRFFVFVTRRAPDTPRQRKRSIGCSFIVLLCACVACLFVCLLACLFVCSF